MRKIFVIFLTILCSCGQNIPCDERTTIDTAKIHWDFFSELNDSLLIKSKKFNLNGQYIENGNGNWDILKSKLGTSTNTQLQMRQDGMSLDGIIIKDNIIMYEPALSKEICGEHYYDWYTYNLDYSLFPIDKIIIETVKGPNNWYIVRTKTK